MTRPFQPGERVKKKVHKKPKLPKELNPQDAYALVREINAQVGDFIRVKLKDIQPRQAWLVYGRALNLLFDRHYRLSMNAADQALTEVEISK